MKKTSLFQPQDLIIYLNLAIFFGGAATAYESNIGAFITTIVIAVLNILYLIYISLIRHKLKKEINKRLEKEIQFVEELDDDTREIYTKAKQVILESNIEVEIKNIMPDAKIIKNAIIPQSTGGFSEIDLIVLHSTGIYIIEAKNITGNLVGDWNDDKLHVVHPSGKEYDITNPVSQNKQHYYRIKDIIGIKEIYRSIIVFADSVNYNFKGIPYQTGVTKLPLLAKTIEILNQRRPIKLEEHQLENIYQNIIKINDETVSKVDKTKKENSDK